MRLLLTFFACFFYLCKIKKNRVLKLIIDIGNTRTKYALFQGDDFLSVYTLEYNELIDHLKQNRRLLQVSSAIVSSVRGSHEELLRHLSGKNIKTVVLTHKTPLPFVNKYKTPETLGKDRIAIAAAINKLFPGRNVLSVDAGTSITYDFVNANHEYLGGGIAPGLRMRFQALNTFTAKLPLVTPNENVWPPLVGATTEEALLSGVMNGMLNEIDGIIDAYKERFGTVVSVLSGGDYKYFDKRLKNSIFARPNLVLEGLLEILNFNEKD